MIQSALDTADHPERLEFALVFADDDETRLDALEKVLALTPVVPAIVREVVPAGTLKFELWNRAAAVATAPVMCIGSDDIVFRTQGWDTIALKNLKHAKDKMVVAWGLDGSPFNGALVNSAFFYREWYEAIGYVYPPQFKHDWGDVWLTEVVRATDRGVFMPEVLIEHMHHLWGKGESDRTFEETNALTSNEPALYLSLAPERRADIVKIRDAMHQPGSHYVPTVSACMIVKDEEAILENCLVTLVSQGVDEIIVVDTGSTDGTVEIAERYGAKVIHYKWNDSFADARNVALAAATSDWVLSIDADEILQCQRRSLKSVLIEAHPVNEVDGFLVMLANVTPQGTLPDRVKMFRLFRRVEGLYWRFRVHENLTVNGRTEFAVGEQPWIMLLHHGYRADVSDQAAKKERNVRLVKMMVEEEPRDPFHLYSLAREYRFRGTEAEQLESLDLFEKAIKMWEAQNQIIRNELWVPTYLSGLYAGAIDAANHLGLWKRGIDMVANIQDEIVNSEFCYCLGYAMANHAKKIRSRKLLPKAIEWLNRAWEDPMVKKQSYEHDPATTTWKPWRTLSAIYTDTDTVKAHMYGVMALLANPDDAETRQIVSQTINILFPRKKQPQVQVA